MAEFSLNFRTIVSGGNTNTLDKTVTVTGDGLDSREASISIGADRQVLVSFTLAALKAYIIVADGNILMQSNSTVGTGTAGDDISLTDDYPLVWYSGNGYSPHFSNTVTSLYFTNTTAAAVTVSIRILRDATP